MFIENTPFLRRVLVLDGAAGLGAGLAMLAVGSHVAPYLGLPADLLFWAGAGLLGCAAFLATFALRRDVPRIMLLDIALINAAWAVASGAILVFGVISPNWIGAAFVLAQAVLVGGFAVLQFAALRSAPLPAT